MARQRRPLFSALRRRRLRAARRQSPAQRAARLAVLLLLVTTGAALGVAVYEQMGRWLGFAPTISASELAQLRAENQRLVADNERLQAGLGASEGRLAIERAARDQLAADLRSAQKESGDLRADLTFFEQLIPADPRSSHVNIRSAEIDRLGGELRYRILLMRTGRPAGEFRGSLQFMATGVRGGSAATVALKPFVAEGTAAPAGDALPVNFRQYQRAEGVLALPEGFAVRSVTVRVLEGGQVRTQTTLSMPR